MTDTPVPLPDAGGSFIRNADGSLAPRPADPDPPEADAAPEKPAAKAAKQPVKEA